MQRTIAHRLSEELYRGYLIGAYRYTDGETLYHIDDDFGVGLFSLREARQAVDFLIARKQRLRVTNRQFYDDKRKHF